MIFAACAAVPTNIVVWYRKRYDKIVREIRKQILRSYTG